MTLTLYHHNSSVCAAKVRVALAEKRLDWTSHLLRLDGDQFDPAYLALNANAVVPTLVHDGRAVIESNVILEYLDDAFPDRPLRPDDPFDRAQARRLMMQLDGEGGVHHAASVITYAVGYRNRLIAQADSTDRAALAGIVEKTMNAKSRARLQGIVFDGIHAVEFRTALIRCETLLADFEQRLSHSPWLAGDRYSIAESSFVSYMIRLDLCQLATLWQDRHAVTDWYTRLRERDSTDEVLRWYDPANVKALTGQGRKVAGEMTAMIAEIREGTDP